MYRQRLIWDGEQTFASRPRLRIFLGALNDQYLKETSKYACLGAFYFPTACKVNTQEIQIKISYITGQSRLPLIHCITDCIMARFARSGRWKLRWNVVNCSKWRGLVGRTEKGVWCGGWLDLFSGENGMQSGRRGDARSSGKMAASFSEHFTAKQLNLVFENCFLSQKTKMSVWSQMNTQKRSWQQWNPVVSRPGLTQTRWERGQEDDAARSRAVCGSWALGDGYSVWAPTRKARNRRRAAIQTVTYCFVSKGSYRTKDDNDSGCLSLGRRLTQHFCRLCSGERFWERVSANFLLNSRQKFWLSWTEFAWLREIIHTQTVFVKNCLHLLQGRHKHSPLSEALHKILDFGIILSNLWERAWTLQNPSQWPSDISLICESIEWSHVQHGDPGLFRSGTNSLLARSESNVHDYDQNERVFTRWPLLNFVLLWNWFAFCLSVSNVFAVTCAE